MGLFSPRAASRGYDFDQFSNISASDVVKYLNMYAKRHEGRYNTGVIDPELQNWLVWYDEYLDKIKRYQGTPYYDLLLNNAFAGFQRSGFDYGVDGYQGFWNDRFNSANKELQRILGVKFENDYNNPVNQVARDRAAGINDALSGQIAGDSPSASAAPGDVLPTPGIDPSVAAQNELLDEQNRFNRVTGAVGTALHFVTSVFSCFGALGQLAKMGSDMVVNAAVEGVQRKKAEETEEQIKALRATNRERVKKSFMDSLVGSMSLPEDGSPLDISGLISSVPRTGFSNEENAYLDDLVSSGYFSDANGLPSAAVLDAYNGKLASISEGSNRLSSAASSVGGLLNVRDALSAIDFITRNVTDYNITFRAAQAKSAVLDNRLDELELLIKSENLKQQVINTGIIGDQAVSQHLQTDYDLQTLGAVPGARDRRLSDLAAEYTEKVTELNSTITEIQQNYQNAVLKIQSGIKNPWIMINSLDFIDQAGSLTSKFVESHKEKRRARMEFADGLLKAGLSSLK